MMKGKKIALICSGVALITGGMFMIVKYSGADYIRVMKEAELALSRFQMLTGREV